MWAREPGVVDSIMSRRENDMFLPGFTLPEQLEVTNDLQAALDGADVVVVAVPSPHLRAVVREAQRWINSAAVIVSVTKGLEAGTGMRMTQVIAEVLEHHDPGAIGVLAGPNLAREVMGRHPGASSTAFTDRRHALTIQQLFTSDRMRVYTSSDVVGCEVSGAVKNVIAIGAGMADGLGFGMNTKAALITRGLAELARVGTALGGDPLTFLGLTGAGDLIATCSSPLSRNRQFGERIAREGISAALDTSATVYPEGVNSVGAIQQIAVGHGVDVPICDTVAAALDGSVTASDAVRRLMSRAATAELHGLDKVR
jgi:glycerol-3-phosphate dehydrogenase (NAD(P)+)